MSATDPPDDAASRTPPATEARRLGHLAPATVRAVVKRRGVTDWLDTAGLRTVHLGLVDASGTLREKRLGASAAARAFEEGWSFIDAIQSWGPDDTVRQPVGATSGLAAVDTGSGRTYPFADDAAFFLAEFGAPLRELSPRFQLQRMVELAASSGFGARVAWEFECIVLELAPGISDAMEPAMAANRCWSALTMATEEEELGRLVDTLEAGAIPIDHVCAELGPGCLEIATAPEPALRSADSAALAKVYTKAHFARAGRRATFMAQLGSGFPGLGGHPSLSLHGLGDDAPLLCDEPGILSKTASWAIAGVVTLLPELLAMTAPYPNSFRRFGPGNWAPTAATWGPEAYSCALRVVAPDPRRARLELRVPGADTSPHHCLAMFLGAAMWGIEERLEPPPPVVPPADGRAGGGRALPRELTEATERFAASTVARQLFGSAFVEHFAQSRRAEAVACHRFVSAEERRRYLDQV
jgi:glutamine synthetase